MYYIRSLEGKEDQEAKISSNKMNYQYAFDELVRYYKTDTLAPASSHDSLMVLLSQQQNPVAQYMLAFEFYNLGDWHDVNQVLDNINNLILTDQEVKQHDDFVQYFHFLKTLSDNGRTIYTLTNSDITSLKNMIGQSSDPIKSYCSNILEANNLLKYYEPILLPEDLKSAPNQKIIKTTPTTTNDWLHVFPKSSQTICYRRI